MAYFGRVIDSVRIFLLADFAKGIFDQALSLSWKNFVCRVFAPHSASFQSFCMDFSLDKGYVGVLIQRAVIVRFFAVFAASAFHSVQPNRGKGVRVAAKKNFAVLSGRRMTVFA